jgi:hypothetical protein
MCRIPYDLAYKVCLEKCYKIRQYLTPLFGPDFANDCMPTEGEEKDQMRRRPGRKPRASPLPGKRKVEDCTDDDNHPTHSLEAVPIKRRSVKPCASGTVNPPKFLSHPSKISSPPSQLFPTIDSLSLHLPFNLRTIHHHTTGRIRLRVPLHKP